MSNFSVSGYGRMCCGRHPWFGPAFFGGYHGFSTYVSTSDLRQALAQYRRLPLRERQLDGPDPKTGRRSCLAYGKMKRP